MCMHLFLPLYPRCQGETGALKNRGTNMCVGAGADIYAGKYVQQYECDDVSEFKFIMGNKF